MYSVSILCTFLLILGTTYAQKQLVVPKSIKYNFPILDVLSLSSDRIYKANESFYAIDIVFDVQTNAFDEILVTQTIKLAKKNAIDINNLFGTKLTPICTYLRNPLTFDSQRSENWFPQCPVGEGLWSTFRFVPVLTNGFYRSIPKKERVNILLEMFFDGRNIGFLDFEIEVLDEKDDKSDDDSDEDSDAENKHDFDSDDSDSDTDTDDDD